MRILSEKQRKPYNFTKFKQEIKRARLLPLDARIERASTYWGRHKMTESVAVGFTLEQIEKIIKEGDLSDQRELSRYFYRVNGEYRNNIDLLAALPLYDSFVVPLLDGKGSKNQIIGSFKQACSFIDALNIPVTFNHITKEWLKTGVYYGILREKEGKPAIQDLPLEYCQTRYKDFNNLNILEFNLQYFERIVDEGLRTQVLATFPEEVQIGWRRYVAAKKAIDPWVLLPAEVGGCCFLFPDDPTPLLLASIPQLQKLEDAIGREEKRDENELYKLLIQKMPVDKDGELVFELDEVADIHASVASMLEDIDTVDVLTTFGDTNLESLQETSAATQSSDRIEKYKNNAYDALGRSAIIFNADGSSTLAYSIKKDEALMITYLNVYEAWLKYQINKRFSRKGVEFDFEILPTTVFNREELAKTKFQGAQYGYSKMYAGVAMGIKQRDQISLMEFENDYLEMSDKMKPLQSSYTTSEKANGTEEKSSKNPSGNNIGNEGGRPALPDEEKSEKTQANIAAAG